MTAEEIEFCFIREFSVHGLQIGKSQQKTERRERVRQAIYGSGQLSWKFSDTQMTYADAFRVCYGERLDRRAAMRDLPDPEPDAGESDEPDET